MRGNLVFIYTKNYPQRGEIQKKNRVSIGWKKPQLSFPPNQAIIWSLSPSKINVLLQFRFGRPKSNGCNWSWGNNYCCFCSVSICEVDISNLAPVIILINTGRQIMVILSMKNYLKLLRLMSIFVLSCLSFCVEQLNAITTIYTILRLFFGFYMFSLAGSGLVWIACFVCQLYTN